MMRRRPTTYTVTWKRSDAPDEINECTKLSSRLFVRRMRELLSLNPGVTVTVIGVYREPRDLL